MLDDLEIQRALRRVAKMSGSTPQQVRRNIELMLEESRACPDPKAQAAWAEIPCAGSIPTMDEVMQYLSEKMRNRR